MYHIDRVVRETGEVQDNGLQEIYVNTKIDDGTDIAESMHIFTDINAYDFEKFPKVSKRKKQFKTTQKMRNQFLILCSACEYRGLLLYYSRVPNTSGGDSYCAFTGDCRDFL